MCFTMSCFPPAVPHEWRDHPAGAHDQPHVRADGSGGGLSCHRVAMRHDLHGAVDDGMAASRQVVDEHAPTHHHDRVQGVVRRMFRTFRRSLPRSRPTKTQGL